MAYLSQINSYRVSVYLKKAAEHLGEFFNKDGFLCKDNSSRYMPGGVEIKSCNNINIGGGKHSNPIVGIIGLCHDQQIANLEIPWFIDVIFSFDGFLKTPVNAKFGSWDVLPYRENQDPVKYRTASDKNDNVKLLKLFVGYLLQYLNDISGRPFNVNNYLS